MIQTPWLTHVPPALISNLLLLQFTRGEWQDEVLSLGWPRMTPSHSGCLQGQLQIQLDCWVTNQNLLSPWRQGSEEVFMCEIGCSVVCSLFFIWVLEIHEIILSMIRTRLKLVLIIRQIAGCPQKSYIVYISYINNNSYFLWLWILHVKVNLQFPLLIFSVFFATPLK